MSRSKKSPLYDGRRVLVVGLGVHGGGVGTVRWLVHQGAKVRVIDSQPRRLFANQLRELAGLPVLFHFGTHRSQDFTWAQRIVVNPAVSPQLPELLKAEYRGVPVENEATIFVRENLGTLIGVTGTRGKTTTTLLLGAILQHAHRKTIISGNVRKIPMLSYLPKVTADTWSVLELSSYQLERLPVAGKAFHVAVFTNLKTDHLNRHGTFAAYSEIKSRLFAGQTKDDVAVLNADDRTAAQLAKHMTGTVQWYGRHLRPRQYGVTVQGRSLVRVTTQGTTTILPLTDWRLLGGHNEENLMAAVTAAIAMGVSTRYIRAAVRAFRPVPHRLEVLGRFAGHRWINDTAATSPDGTLSALQVFPTAVYIVGGTDKALDMTSLAKALRRRKLPIVVLPGTASEKFIRAIGSGRTSPFIVRASSMESAVRAAVAVAKTRQDIILSPGAASFGLFRHEFHRGEEFIRQVHRL